MKRQNKEKIKPSINSSKKISSLSKHVSSKENSFQRIYNVVRTIPKGKVMTYKQVSILAHVATPRIVGFALHVNRDPQNIPCHRVVFANGQLTPGYAFGGEDVQRKKLQKEGVIFLNTKVHLAVSQV